MFGYRRRWWLIIIVIFLIAITIIADMKIKSSILQLARSKAQLTETAAINRIVNEQVVNNIEYQELVTVHKDGQGRIVMIQPNTIMLNHKCGPTASAFRQDSCWDRHFWLVMAPNSE